MHAYDRRTDGQTDGQNYNSQDRPGICSRGKKPFSALQRLKAELGVSGTYREIKRCGRTTAI